MSNLVKQNYIIAASTENVRVINSNQAIEEKLSHLADELKKAREEELKSSEKEEGGEFSEGIVAEEIQALQEPTAEELLENAKEEAKAILDAARAQADEMLNDAHKKGLQEFEEQKKNGYAAGAEALRAELEEEKQKLIQELDISRQEYENRYQEKMDTMEQDLIEVLIQVFDHVFHIQFEDKKDILVALASNMLQNAESGKNFRIHVAPADADVMKQHVDEFTEIIGNGAVVEIVRDPKLAENECQIETEYGLFDCGLDTEYQNLIKDIRSLCK